MKTSASQQEMCALKNKKTQKHKTNKQTKQTIDRKKKRTIGSNTRMKFYYYFALPLLLQHSSSASDGGRNGGGGLLRHRPLRPRYDGMVVEANARQDSVTMASNGECNEVTENPLQRQEKGCPCFSLDTMVGLTTDLNKTEYCSFDKHDDGDEECSYEHMGFSAHWNQEASSSGLFPYSDSHIGFSVNRNCDDYGDSGGYVFVRNDWFEDELGVIRMDLGQNGGVLTFVPSNMLRGGEFDWNEVWPVFADINGNPIDPSKWKSTVSFQAEELTFTFGPYPTLTPDPPYDDRGINTFDVNDYASGSLECGDDFDADNNRFYIILNGELLDSCPKSIVENYTFDPSIIDNIEEEYTTRERFSCSADSGRSKGSFDNRGWQSTWESHSYSINFETTKDEYEDCVNILTAFKDTIPAHCDISN